MLGCYHGVEWGKSIWGTSLVNGEISLGEKGC
ncbi:hypothetical protein BM1374166_01851 [Bartonella tribocorum]|nr:hypothetical protein BM1374166_01851 [Bartonella tribocorum]